MKKKILMSALTLILTLCSAFAVNAENEFPPKRPEVGNMKIVKSSGGNVIVGLRSNGTINVSADPFDPFGKGISGELRNELLSLTDVVDVACTFNAVAALKSDGTVYVGENKGENYFKDIHPFEAASTWTDIVAIACGNYHLIGLKSDGTVVSTHDSKYDFGAHSVTGWSDVSSIYARDNYSVAVTKHGDVLPAGDFSGFYYLDINKIRSMKNVQKFSSDLSVGLLTDGNVFPLVKKGTATSYDTFGTITETKGEEMTLEELLKQFGFDIKIKDVEFLKDNGYGTGKDFIILDDKGDLYELEFSYMNWLDGHINEPKLTKVGEDIIYIWNATPKNKPKEYYAVDSNGQIWSYGDSAKVFSSSDWILTTNITYDGKKINSDVAPYIKNDRTLAPIRAILEALGMEVEWDGETKTAIAVKGDISIKITIDSNIAIVNGKEQTLDVPAEVTQNRTFVPVRFFAEALNLIVDWNGNSKTVIIKSK